MTAAEAIAVAGLEEANRLATEFEAMGGGVLTMAGTLARVLVRTRAAPRVGGPLDQFRDNFDGPRGRCRRGGLVFRRGGCRRGSFRRRGGRREARNEHSAEEK